MRDVQTSMLLQNGYDKNTLEYCLSLDTGSVLWRMEKQQRRDGIWCDVRSSLTVSLCFWVHH